MRRWVLVTLLLALSLVQPVYAQGSQEPETPLPSAPAWESIPDIAPYQSFTVPQCADCNGQNAIIDPYEDAEFPELSWDIRAVFGGLIRWLLSGVANLFRWLVCWLLDMLQHIANFLALVVNALVFVLNFIWRFLIFSWLSLRRMFYSLFWLYELFRDFWQDVNQALLVITAWINEIIRLLLAALALIGSLIWQFILIQLRIIAILAWIGSLSFAFITQIFLALQGVNPPDDIAGTHPAYSIVRGGLDGLFDSQIGWLLWLYIAMAYVAWITWLARFFGGARD